jgi:hypothetical protein
VLFAGATLFFSFGMRRGERKLDGYGGRVLVNAGEAGEEAEKKARKRKSNWAEGD